MHASASNGRRVFKPQLGGPRPSSARGMGVVFGTTLAKKPQALSGVCQNGTLVPRFKEMWVVNSSKYPDQPLSALRRLTVAVVLLCGAVAQAETGYVSAE